MAKDPGFVFYPGDYLRDTQCLSEVVQVAYDRIMCEHMRNICISQQQLNFFTKKLSLEEKDELLTMLTKVAGGFQIDWVVDSITKRRAYSESRAKNRVGKKKEKPLSYEKDMNTYVPHMDNEIEIEIDSSAEGDKGGLGGKEGVPLTENSEEIFIVPEMLAIFKAQYPEYVFQREKDFPALKKIADTIATQEKLVLLTPEGFVKVKEIWTGIVGYLPNHRLYRQFSISQIEKYFQSIAMAFTDSLKKPAGDSYPHSIPGEKKNTIQTNLEAASAATNYLAGKYG